MAFPDNTELLAGLMRGESAAWTRMIDRFGPLVQHIVGSALGIDPDLADVVQEVFVRVMERVHQLRDPPALRNWIATIAVFTARGHIRKRRRGRWLSFFAPADMPEPVAQTSTADERSLVTSTYRLLDALPAQERLAFSLRFIAEMELTEVAAACGVSLATVKRRLRNATRTFMEQAQRDPDLRARIERAKRRAPPVMPPTRTAACMPPA